MNESRANSSVGLEASITSANDAEVVAAADLDIVKTIYWVLVAVGAFFNIAILVTLARAPSKKSRVDVLLMHLAIADVLVACGVLPLEIGWEYTDELSLGSIMCKVLLVTQAFGFYLLSNVHVCISLDRFFAVFYPLKQRVVHKARNKRMLCCAWVTAFVCSLPQCAVFRVLEHPRVPGFEQCVSFDAFSNRGLEIAYNVGCLCIMYFIPLLIITVCYTCIFWKIRSYSIEPNESCAGGEESDDMRLHRSNPRLLERARRRTLRMTLIVVSVFALCWLPYAVMTLWYMIDKESASRVSPQLQDLLFALAACNSCINPFMYGSYVFRNNETYQKLMKICRWSSSPTNDTGNVGMIPLRNKDRKMDVEAIELNEMNNQRTGSSVRFAETSLVEGEAALPPRYQHQCTQLECQKNSSIIEPSN